MKRYIRSATINPIENEDSDVLSDVALSSTDPRLLRKLANHNDEYIRLNVAMNSNAPVDVLEKLSKDRYMYIREWVAMNKNSSPELLDKMVHDTTNSYGVWKNIAHNNRTSPETLEFLAEDKLELLRAAVASNPFTPKDLLYKLAQDASYEVQKSVVQNPNTPIKALNELTNGSIGIRKIATERIAKVMNK